MYLTCLEPLRYQSESSQTGRYLKEHPNGDGPIAPLPRRPYRRHKVGQRLSTEAVSEIMAAYQGGATADELAARHGVARSSITRLLHERGVAVRRQSPTAADVERMAQLHAQGLSGRAIAAQTGFSASTVSRVVRQLNSD